MIRAVAFDVGETLVDESRVWALWAERVGVSVPVFFAALGAVIERREHHRRVFDLLRPGWEPAGVDDGFAAADLYPDVVPALAALAGSGFALAAVGNTSTATEALLRRVGLPFALVASSEGWGVHKPDPAFFVRLAAELGCPAAEVAYVGDRVDNDVVPAAAAGMTAILVRRGPWGYVHAGWPEAARAHARVDSLAELPAVIAGLGR